MPNSSVRPRLLVLYSPRSSHVSTTHDYLSSFSNFSKFEVFYCEAVAGVIPNFDLQQFDAIFVSYCCCLRAPAILSEYFIERLKLFSGVKILSIQDEYDGVFWLRQKIKDIKFDFVLTCVPESHIDRVYPPSEFPGCRFVNVLTGYVPDGYDLASYSLPLAERQTLIGYRGRRIGVAYGRLGYLKLEVGRRFRAACQRRSLPHDIDWTEESRIYGDDWFRFLGSCRATLGSESGSSLFDDGEGIRKRVIELEKEQPDIEYPGPIQEMLAPFEDIIPMGQISPRIFEAAALRTPMCLMEGSYSGILQPGRHYIPIAPDFSNVDHVIDQLDDFRRLESMVDRAYTDLIASQKYSYRRFVELVDSLIDSKAKTVSSPYTDITCQDLEDDIPHAVFIYPTLKPLTRSHWVRRRNMVRHRVVLASRLQDIPAGEPLLIYGAGSGGIALCRRLETVGRRVDGFLDSHRSGECDGLPLYHAENLLEKLPEGSVVVVASIYVDDIVSKLLLAEGKFRIFDAYPLIASSDTEVISKIVYDYDR